jgi:hypothetical protein
MCVSTYIGSSTDTLLGVLTKPDTLTQGASGSLKRWQDIIEDREHELQSRGHRLKHGYYVVRLPDDEERSRNINRADTLRIATEFFENTPPWSGIANRNRLGIPNLVSDISRLLVNFIENR